MLTKEYPISKVELSQLIKYIKDKYKWIWDQDSEGFWLSQDIFLKEIGKIIYEKGMGIKFIKMVVYSKVSIKTIM